MSLTYIIACFMSAICSAIVAVYVWRRRALTGGKALTMLLASSSVWVLFSGLHEVPASLETRILLVQVYFVAIVLVPVSMLVFTLQYTGHERWVTKRFLALLMVVPAVTIALVWTNSVHHLVWTEIHWDLTGGTPAARYLHGPMFWVWTGFAYITVLTGTVFLILFLRRTTGIIRGQNAALLLAVTAPWAGNVLYLLRLTPWPELDVTAFGFVVTGLAMSWGVFRLQISNIIPVARESVLASMTDAVFVLDLGGHLVEFNPAATRLLGTDLTKFIGDDADNLFASHPVVMRELKSSLENAGGSCEIDMGTQENPCYFDMRVARVSNRNGEQVGTSIVLRDVTELKQAQENRLQLETRLQRSQKLESLGVLAGGIAHDFNNLLLGISGNAELALHEVGENSAIRGNLQNIEKISFRAAELCRQLLAYSGKGKFVVEPMDINHMIREMDHLLGVSKSAPLRYELEEGLPAIKADLAQMQQLIMNLVINAVEALEDKSGTVMVKTKTLYCDRFFLNDMDIGEELEPGTYVCLEVEDSGIGMDREIRQKVFEPFFTTKFAGRGLGMSAVLGIIRGHNAGLRIESEPGRGTIFRIVIPASTEQVIIPDIKPVDSWVGKGTVLIVDDEEMIRQVGKLMLEKLEFSVLTSVDGEDALDQYQKHRNEITCVLLDLEMPNMGGQECFRQLRRIKNDLRIVIMSGYSEQDVTQKFVGRGFGAFVHKPFRMKQLQHAMQSALSA